MQKVKRLEYMVNMADPYFSVKDRKTIHQEIDLILDNALSMGHNVKMFEKEFSNRIGAQYAIAMNSCTSTLEAALQYYNIKGREVIVPVETFIATGMAVHLAGGIPIFSDISKDTFCLDLKDVQKRVTSNTAGIILVHMAGMITPDAHKFRSFCDKNGLFLIEDAAHSPGAILDGKYAGNIGHVGCFSFYPTKIITSGEGGMLTTNDSDIANYARSYQNRGRDMQSAEECYIIPGRNVRMSEMNALLGRVQLSHLDEYLYRRRQIAKMYSEMLYDLQGVQLVIPNKFESSSFWKFILLLDATIDRAGVTEYMKSEGVTVDWSYTPALHLQPIFRRLYNTYEGQLPCSEDYLSRHICLPCHPRITDEETLYVASTLKKAIYIFSGMSKK
jgi:perosamine synthetase